MISLGRRTRNSVKAVFLAFLGHINPSYLRHVHNNAGDFREDRCGQLRRGLDASVIKRCCVGDEKKAYVKAWQDVS